jgi:hypothetical protein
LASARAAKDNGCPTLAGYMLAMIARGEFRAVNRIEQEAMAVLMSKTEWAEARNG